MVGGKQLSGAEIRAAIAAAASGGHQQGQAPSAGCQAAEAAAGWGQSAMPMASSGAWITLDEQPLQRVVTSGPTPRSARPASPAGSATSSVFVRVHQHSVDWPPRGGDEARPTAVAAQGHPGSAGSQPPPTQSDPESDSPDSSAGAQPSAQSGDRLALRRKAFAWPPQRQAPDDEAAEAISPRSATSTVVSRTFSEPEAQPQRRPRGVDRACSPIREAPAEGPAMHAEQPADAEFSYPPLGCLLGDQAGDTLAPDGGVLLGQSSDTWHLQLEAAPTEVPAHVAGSDACEQTASDLPPQPLDLLGQIPLHPRDQVGRPWRRAASPTRRAAEGAPRKDIPVKAPPRTKPQPCRIGSEPVRQPPDQGQAHHPQELPGPAGHTSVLQASAERVDQPPQSAQVATRSQPAAARRGRVRIADQPQDVRPPPLEPDEEFPFTVSIIKPAPIQTMLPLGGGACCTEEGCPVLL